MELKREKKNALIKKSRCRCPCGVRKKLEKGKLRRYPDGAKMARSI